MAIIYEHPLSPANGISVRNDVWFGMMAVRMNGLAQYVPIPASPTIIPLFITNRNISSVNIIILIIDLEKKILKSSKHFDLLLSTVYAKNQENG